MARRKHEEACKYYIPNMGIEQQRGMGAFSVAFRITRTTTFSRPFDTAPSFDTPGHSSGLLRIERSPTQDKAGSRRGSFLWQHPMHWLCKHPQAAFGSSGANCGEVLAVEAELPKAGRVCGTRCSARQPLLPGSRPAQAQCSQA